jgi:acyl-CoA synthetase (NDP forming)
MHAKVARANAAQYAAAAKESGKPLVAYSYTQLAEGVADAFAEQGIPVLTSQEGVARGIAALVELGSRKVPQRSDTQVTPGEAAPLPGGAAGARVLHEAEVKAWLARSGFTVPAARLVRGEQAAVEAAELAGYPVVAKVQAAALPHKSDHGVVALNLRSADEVRAAYREISQRARNVVGEDEVAGVLVEHMVPAGFEMLAGITRDPLMGPFLTVGAGGRLAEIFHDVVVLPAPATAEEVRAAIATLRCGAAFASGRPATLDAEAFCELAARISVLAAGTPELAELDLNPIIVHGPGSGADIVDALAVRMA